MTNQITRAFNSASSNIFGPFDAPAVKQAESTELQHTFNGIVGLANARPITAPANTAPPITLPEPTVPDTAQRVSNLHEVIGLPRIPRRKHG